MKTLTPKCQEEVVGETHSNKLWMKIFLHLTALSAGSVLDMNSISGAAAAVDTCVLERQALQYYDDRRAGAKLGKTECIGPSTVSM